MNGSNGTLMIAVRRAARVPAAVLYLRYIWSSPSDMSKDTYALLNIMVVKISVFSFLNGWFCSHLHMISYFDVRAKQVEDLLRHVETITKRRLWQRRSYPH